MFWIIDGRNEKLKKKSKALAMTAWSKIRALKISLDPVPADALPLSCFLLAKLSTRVNLFLSHFNYQVLDYTPTHLLALFLLQAKVGQPALCRNQNQEMPGRIHPLMKSPP
jgi:hypothetical protein